MNKIIDAQGGVRNGETWISIFYLLNSDMLFSLFIFFKIILLNKFSTFLNFILKIINS